MIQNPVPLFIGVVLSVFLTASPTYAEESIGFHPWRAWLKLWEPPVNFALQAGASTYVAPLCRRIASKCPNENLKIPKCMIAVRDYIRASDKQNNMDAKGNIEGTSQYFTEEVGQLNTDPAALGFLTDLESRLKNPRTFNLWSYTVNNRHIKNDPSLSPKWKGIKFLAVLLQRSYVAGGRLSPEVAEKIRSVNSMLNSRVSDGTVQGYPPPIDLKNRGIYHFYSNAYLFRKMWIEKGVPLKYAAIGTWALNQKYEDFKGNDGSDLHKIGDVYTGYAGVDFAVSSNVDRYDGPSFSQMQSDLRSNDLSFVDRFIDRIPNFCTDGWAPYDSQLFQVPTTQAPIEF